MRKSGLMLFLLLARANAQQSTNIEGFSGVVRNVSVESNGVAATIPLVQDGLPHQPDRFLGRMIEFLLIRSAHDELRRGRIPDGGVLARLAVPGCVLLPHKPAWLVGKPVGRPREVGPAFIPDDLLMVHEAVWFGCPSAGTRWTCTLDHHAPGRRRSDPRCPHEG